MRASVSIWTVRGDDLDTIVPEDRGDVGEWLRVLAGPAGQAGGESFDLLVCTPVWLGRHVAEHGPQIGRHHLIVEAWDAQQVRDTVTRLFERESAEDWPRLAERLSRLGYWEFEDYQPDRHSGG